MFKRESTPDNWRKLWTKREIDEVYPTSEVLLENLLQIVDVKGLRILEVGAGSGRDSIRLAKKGAIVYVLDYIMESLDVVKTLAEREHVAVHCILGDALALPILPDTFDLVFHQGLLEHFRSPLEMKLLQENHRILKSTGMALVDVPQTFHIYTVIKKILIFFDKWFAGWETQFTISELRQKMKQAGFTEIHSYGEWMYPSLFYRIIREIFWKLRLAKLPLYLPRVPLFSDWQERFWQKVRHQEWCKWTFLSIGVVGRKQ